MYKNFIKIAMRNLRKQPGYSFINISGLAIGMTCCLLILLYVRDEFSYDLFHENSRQIYRLVLEGKASGSENPINTVRTPAPWAPVLANDYPGILNYVRFKTPLSRWLISYQNKRFYEKGFYFADASVFEVFGFELIRGNPKTVLQTANSVVITKAMARKYFGENDPLGKILTADNAYEFKVTGIMEEVPRNSHIDFDFLASFVTLTVPANEQGNFIYGGDVSNMQFFGLNPDIYTYLLLQENYTPAEFEKVMPEFLDRYFGTQLRQIGIVMQPYLQPLSSIHLHSNLDAELSPNSDIAYIYIFGAIALFILLIACINFMNLATARSANRAREVGMRKVVGSNRQQLIIQFMGESLFLSLLALLLAALLVPIVLPFFNALSGKELTLRLADIRLIPAVFAIALLVGIIAGSYPAFFLSAFRPITVLRGTLKAGSVNTRLRRILVILQFAISIIFIIGTAIVYKQLNYVQNKRLGFQKEQVVVTPLIDTPSRMAYLAYKNVILQNPNVLAASASASVPGGLVGVALIHPQGIPANENVTMEQLFVDHDFIETLDIEILKGRNFSFAFPTDTMEAFIINETAARQFSWQDSAIGKRIEMVGFKRGRVIGVAKDFHVKSLHQKIEPLVLHLAPTADVFLHVSVRIGPEDIPATLTFLESKWREMNPNYPFEYSFLDEDFDSLYRAEELRGKVFVSFSIFALVTACLGLFGLAAFMAEQRTKEIGIRRVLGASVPGLIALLSKEFIILVILSNIIAWPVALIFMNNWLQDFAYQTEIGLLVFFLAGGIALVIAGLTVSFQAIKAALANPVEALQYE
ncbi:MAG: ABC transporter permease [bacterium]